MLTDLIDELLWFVRSFKSLQLHEADDFTPVTRSYSEIVPVFITRVQTLDYYSEWLDLNLTKRVVLTEEASGVATFVFEEALAFELAERVVVQNFA